MARGVDVVAPDGRRWRIRRRWVPRLGEESLPGRMWRRARGTAEKVGDGLDPVSGCLDGAGEGIVVAIGLIVAGLLLVFVVVPFLVALVDVLILLLIAGASLVARALGWHPWVVHARADDGTVLEWRITGWRASSRLVERIGVNLAAGLPLPPTGIVDAGAV